MKTLKFWLFASLLAVGLPVAQTGCSNPVTLEAGGAYSDATLATTDQAILDASHALTGFVGWADANATYLARWPEVGALSASVAAQKDAWIRDAYAARDAYAVAAKAYRLAAGTPAADQTEVERKRAALQGALAVLTNLTTQIAAYRAAHTDAK